MAEVQRDQAPVPDATSDGSPSSNSATRPTIKLATSPGSYRIASPKGMKPSMTLSVVTGRFPHLHEELMALDKNGDGQIDADELAAVVEKITEKQSTIRHMRFIIAALLVLVVLIVGANFGLSFATAALSQKVKSGNGNALVDSSTGVTLRTASGQISAPYMVLDAIRGSDNVTTIRYTLPRSVGQAGCQLYSEGHFSIPASLVGPEQVYGSSNRPRTYTILEVVGCTPGGSLSDNSALEATLQADMFENKVYLVFTCPPNDPSANCTASEFVTPTGTSLPNYSPVTRRMLTASTPDLLAHMSTASRRAVLLSVVPGAAPASGDHAALSTIALTPVMEMKQPATTSAATRSLQGSDGATQDDDAEPLFYALPALTESLSPSAAPDSRQLHVEAGRSRRKLLCSNTCQMTCSWGQYPVYTNMTADGTVPADPTEVYICVFCPKGFYCPFYPYDPSVPNAPIPVPYSCPPGTTTTDFGARHWSDCKPVSGRRLAEGEQGPSDLDDDAAASHALSHPKATQMEQPVQASTATVRGSSGRPLQSLSRRSLLCDPCIEKNYALGGDCPKGQFMVGDGSVDVETMTSRPRFYCADCLSGLYCPGIFNTPMLCPGGAINAYSGGGLYWNFYLYDSGTPTRAKTVSECPPYPYKPIAQQLAPNAQGRRLGEEDPVPMQRQTALAVYRQHIYASPDVSKSDLSFYDCVICTYLWRQGLLSDEMYRGDLMFGALLKQYAPWVHGGYLTYGRKVVQVLTQLDEWYTSEVTGPLVTRWSHTMSWAVGEPGATFSLEGALILTAGLPGTLALGVAQAVLPVVAVDVLAWAMVAWIAVTALAHWAAAAVVGLGWLGLLLPQAAVLAGLYHLTESHVSRSKQTTK